MPSNNNHTAERIALTVPVIFLVLAATAIPIELRAFGEAKFEFGLAAASTPISAIFRDILANIFGYVPVGLVLGELGLLRAVFLAGLISTFAESSQLVMMHRDPSFSDIVSNVAGATLGALVSVHWKIRSAAFRISRWKAALALLLAFALVVRMRSVSAVNARGDISPGTLEASWRLDESIGRSVSDSSGHGLAGKFGKEPTRIVGVRGHVVAFDGTNYVNFGRSIALRLSGSMTISAWIDSSSYPGDDAVIVSQLQKDSGYQLDTTVDRGPRTIGFKLTDACGGSMARYGATPLALDTRYYVAGVYDAAAQTLDVYLNGELDNGFLLGPVSSRQRSSRGAVYVGRRGNSDDYNFLGSIDNVRIYSFALTKSQIAADQRGEVIQDPATQRAAAVPSCAPLSVREDKGIPAAAAVLGMLVAVACISIWPSKGPWIALGFSLIAGFFLLWVTGPTLPAFNNWTVPLTGLAGGVAIAISVRRKNGQGYEPR
jgi:VanZ family protein